MNTFAIICYILALSAFIKAMLGLIYHKRFYNWAKEKYGQAHRSKAVNVLLIFALFLLLYSWYGVFFDYVRYGWIVTAFITLASVKSLSILFSWEKTATKFRLFIEKQGNHLHYLDVALLIMSLIFWAMGTFLY